ncbi:hypothetical protein D3C74_476580 [compost metagenome]
MPVLVLLEVIICDIAVQIMNSKMAFNFIAGTFEPARQLLIRIHSNIRLNNSAVFLVAADAGKRTVRIFINNGLLHDLRSRIMRN